MQKKTYFIQTFGCQMNYSDSERMAAFLESRGFKLATQIELADLAIINTCGVRQAAENRVYTLVHKLCGKNVSKKTPAIVLTGCLAKRADVQKRLKNKVELFFQISDFKLFENWIIKNYLGIRNSELGISPQNNSLSNKEAIAYLSINPKHTNSFQAFVPIMTGCNNFCAYCVVPHARGREVSRPAAEIIREVKTLIKQGYKQIILLGQNVNSYQDQRSKVKSQKQFTGDGLPVTDYVNFSQLLREIDSIPGHFWVHFVSSHPKDMSTELIETVAQGKNLCEYIHLPLQAGDDTVLKNMNRKYTQKHYLGLIKKIKTAFEKSKPGIPYAITTDIIVGFPGETKKQLLESAKVMKNVSYDMAFFGRFSPRPGTAAWQMRDNVSAVEKARREKVLNDILAETLLANNQQLLGRTEEILIEKETDKFYFGKTRTLKNVRLSKKKKGLMGSFIKAAITKANVWNLEGEIIV